MQQAKKIYYFQDWRLAKTATWLKRHDFIQWKSRDEAFEYITECLDARQD